MSILGWAMLSGTDEASSGTTQNSERYCVTMESILGNCRDSLTVPSPGAMEFHLFRSSADRTLFIATAGADPNQLLPCPNSGTWIFFKKFHESGQTRIAFSEPDAKRDIAERGFHLTRAGVKAASFQ